MELELISSIQSHDNRNAFAFLVREHQSGLRGYLLQMCHGHQELADEIAQETFLKAYRSIHTFKNKSKFSTWLFQIARNIYFDSLKRKSQDGIENSSEVGGQNSDLKIDLVKALNGLTLEEREVILLSYVEGVSHEDIAEMTSTPLGTVKSRILQARNKMLKFFLEV